MKKILTSLIMLCLYSGAWANDELIALTSPWLAYQSKTDDINIKTLPASAWKPVKLDGKHHFNTVNGIYGWYKTTFDWNQIGKQALYIETIYQGDETYLNGEKIGGLGTIRKPWKFNQSSPRNMPRAYPIPTGLLQAQENTLLIKVNFGYGNTYIAEFFGGIGINSEPVYIGLLDKIHARQYKRITSILIADAAIIFLSIVDILIVLFLFKKTFHRFPEFPWLLINGILLVFSTLTLDLFFITDNNPIIFFWLDIFSILIAVLAFALYFWSFEKQLPLPWVYTYSGLFLLVSISVLFPLLPSQFDNAVYYLWLLLTYTLLLYSLYLVINRVRKKHVGAIIQMVGFIVYLFSIRLEWTPLEILGNRNILWGLLFFRYCLLLSYFQRIAQMSQHYKYLSKEMLHTIEDNKQSIAREIHDDLGQRLATAKMALPLFDIGKEKQAITAIKKELTASTVSVRRILQGLHPVILETYSLKEALQKESDRISGLHAVNITLDLDDGGIELDKKIKTHLFRIFQETIHNAINHGDAKHIAINLKISNSIITFIIRDDGKGFTTDGTHQVDEVGGFGTISLKERVHLINGTMKLRSMANNGVEVTIKIALK